MDVYFFAANKKVETPRPAKPGNDTRRPNSDAYLNLPAAAAAGWSAPPNALLAAAVGAK